MTGASVALDWARRFSALIGLMSVVRQAAEADGGRLQAGFSALIGLMSVVR